MVQIEKEIKKIRKNHPELNPNTPTPVETAYRQAYEEYDKLDAGSRLQTSAFEIYGRITNEAIENYQDSMDAHRLKSEEHQKRGCCCSLKDYCSSNKNEKEQSMD